MKRQASHAGRLLSVMTLVTALMLPALGAQAQHDIRGIQGPTFNLYAFPFNMNLPDGSSMYMWGFGDMDGGSGATHDAGDGYNLPQYPAPTLIVTEGASVTINLTNYGVPQGVNIIVTGHEVSAAGGTVGPFTSSAEIGGGGVAYTFDAPEPGTYIYHSMNAPSPGLHREMGLAGALIVRPAGPARAAYNESGTEYDQEYLYLLSDMDPDVHLQMERGHYTHITNSDRFAKIWFVNGRVFPDLFQGDYNTALFPHQPYQALAQAHPGDNVLVREINIGQDSHPFHHHGENLRFLARDGRVLSSNGTDADLGRSDNTINSAPMQVVDMIWTWTGKSMNWDIYGPVNTTCTDGNDDMADDGNNEVNCHDDFCRDGIAAGGLVDPPDGFDDYNHEYCPDHGKALADKVSLPGVQDLSLGGWWSGSPFLGETGGLPPGEGGLNPFGGYFFVWHSHAEKELTTFDVFPGGSLSAVVVLPPYRPIN